MPRESPFCIDFFRHPAILWLLVLRRINCRLASSCKIGGIPVQLERARVPFLFSHKPGAISQPPLRVQ
jgi:hypothetical protein